MPWRVRCCSVLLVFWAVLVVLAVLVGGAGGAGDGSGLRADDALGAGASDPADSADVSFHRDVRPILVQHCQGCHQPARPLGGLVLTDFAGLLRGGESETPGLVAGQPDDSELLRQVISHNGQPPAMPKNQPPLVAADVQTIRRWIAAGAVDDTPAAARAPVDADHPPRYRLPPVVTSLDFSPDGRWLAVSGYHEVLLYATVGFDGEAASEPQLELAARLVGAAERIESAVFSPDGRYLAVCGGSPARFGEVQVWEVAKRELVQSTTVGFDTLYGASWSPEGKLLAFGCPDNTVRVIEAAGGRQVLKQGAHADWVLATIFSNDGSHLVSASRDRSLKLTELATQRFVDDITSITPGALKGGLNSIDRRPGKDEVVVGGADGQPKLYRIFREEGRSRQIGDDFNRLRTYETLPGQVYVVKFNQDGSRFLAGSSYDRPPRGERLGELRIFQTDDGRLVSRMHEQLPAVYAAAFHPAGRLVVAAGYDGLLRVWQVDDGRQVAAFPSVPLSRSMSASAPTSTPSAAPVTGKE